MQRKIIAGLFGIALVFTAQNAFALTYQVLNSTFAPTTIGDFIVSGVTVGSGTGLNYEVLKFPSGSAYDCPAGTCADKAPHHDVKTGDLWSLLNSAGITSANALVFGFDVNETGATGSNPVDVTALHIEVCNGGSCEVFDLGNNIISVYNYGSGGGNSEAKIQINLPYDFMTTFNASSTDEFYIGATHTNTSDGDEEYFLSAAFTRAVVRPVPEPMSLSLMGMGLLGLAGRRRKLRGK